MAAANNATPYVRYALTTAIRCLTNDVIRLQVLAVAERELGLPCGDVPQAAKRGKQHTCFAFFTCQNEQFTKP